MNRALLFGIAMFVAVVGIALVGADNEASAFFRHRGCNGCACSGACDGGCSASDCGGCNGGCSASACCGRRHHCCGLFHRLKHRCHGRCHGCNGGCSGCNGGCSAPACGGCSGGDAPAADAPAETPPPAPAAT